METVLVVLAVVAVYVIVGLGRTARSGDLDTTNPVTGEKQRPAWVAVVGVLGVIVYIVVMVARHQPR